jgi:hypothetical protein
MEAGGMSALSDRVMAYNAARRAQESLGDLMDALDAGLRKETDLLLAEISGEVATIQSRVLSSRAHPAPEPGEVKRMADELSRSATEITDELFGRRASG